MLLEKIEELLKEVDSLTAQNAEEVEQLRIKYLSKRVKSMPSWPTSAMCQATRKRGWYQNQRIEASYPCQDQRTQGSDGRG